MNRLERNGWMERAWYSEWLLDQGYMLIEGDWRDYLFANPSIPVEGRVHIDRFKGWLNRRGLAMVSDALADHWYKEKNMYNGTSKELRAAEHLFNAIKKHTLGQYSNDSFEPRPGVLLVKLENGQLVQVTVSNVVGFRSLTLSDEQEVEHTL